MNLKVIKLENKEKDKYYYKEIKNAEIELNGGRLIIKSDCLVITSYEAEIFHNLSLTQMKNIVDKKNNNELFIINIVK